MLFKRIISAIFLLIFICQTFDKNFISKLIEPIFKKRTIGTFSKEEFVANKNNIWSKCWNLNKNLPTDRMHPKDYPDQQAVFRAILKKDFEKSGGFKPIGYIEGELFSSSKGGSNEEGTILKDLRCFFNIIRC